MRKNQTLVQSFQFSVLTTLIFNLVVGMASTGAWAKPSRKEAYRNDQLGIVVYEDNSDPDLYWYTPQLKVQQDAGKTLFRKRVDSKSNTVYTFYVIPYFSPEIEKLLANEIPNLRSRQQLKPVVARKFGIQVPLYNISTLSADVTDFAYINKPQLVRLTLDTDQAADFEDLFSASPGIPVHFYLNFESERLEKFLNIKLSANDVYQAMEIGLNGQYSFTRAEISHKIEKYLLKTDISIRSKGSVPNMDSIIEKVLQHCFDITKRPTSTDPYYPPPSGGPIPTLPPISLPEKPGSGGIINLAKPTEVSPPFLLDMQTLQLFSSSHKGPLTREERRKAESFLRQLPAVAPTTPSIGETRISVEPSSAPAPEVNKELVFTFKSNLANNTVKTIFDQQQFADTQEILIIPYMLSAQVSDSSLPVVESLGRKDLVTPYAASQKRPFGTGIHVKTGDQWLIQTSFSLAAESNYSDGRQYYRWLPEWGSTAGDLYYKVGESPWMPVNGRAVTGADSLFEGELQFYIDRESIWKKIPEKLRESGWFMPAVFSFRNTYPEFNLVLTGKRVQQK